MRKGSSISGILFQVEDHALADQGIQYPIDHGRQRGMTDDVPFKEFPVRPDQRKGFILVSHEAFKPPIGRMKTMPVANSPAARTRRLQQAEQLPFLIDPDVAAGLVVIGRRNRPADPLRPKAWNGDDQVPARLQDPDQLQDGGPALLDMLQDLGTDHHVKNAFGERQFRDIGPGDQPAATRFTRHQR